MLSDVGDAEGQMPFVIAVSHGHLLAEANGGDSRGWVGEACEDYAKH